MVDVVRGRIEFDRTIRIVGDRIASIGPTATTTLPSDMQRIDVSGGFVVPGLFDMHAHAFCGGEDCSERLKDARPKLARYAAAGVLGIRDMGSPIEEISELARDASTPAAVWFAGPTLDGPRNPP